MIWISTTILDLKKLKIKRDCQQIYHVGYTRYHSNTEVEQHWTWIILGWDSLWGISGSADPHPHPMQTEHSLIRFS
jgi:hypothetical protein